MKGGLMCERSEYVARREGKWREGRVSGRKGG